MKNKSKLSTLLSRNFNKFVEWLLTPHGMILRKKTNYTIKSIKITFIVFMVFLILVGVVEVGYISIIKGKDYKTLAETYAYQENKDTAVRGTIYDSEMNILSMSYGKYYITVDPYILDRKFEVEVGDVIEKYYQVINNNYKLKAKRLDDISKENLKNEIKEKYYDGLSEMLAYFIDEGLSHDDEGYISKNEIKKILETTTYVDNDTNETKNLRYKKISDEPVSAETMEKLNDVLKGSNSAGFNFYYNYFYCYRDPNLPEPKTKKEKALRYYYNYQSAEYTESISFNVQHKINEPKLRAAANKCRFDIDCFSFEKTYMRQYPQNGFCSSVLGFVDNDGKPIGGLEKYYDDILSGKNGQIAGLAVSNSGRMESISHADESKKHDGYHLVTTIKPDIQEIVEENLKSSFYKYDADETFCVVMNPNNGAVYAMGNYPNYDANDPRKITDEEIAIAKATQEFIDTPPKDENGNEREATEKEIRQRALDNQWSNFCVSYPYELGSTFKIFTASAAIEEGCIDPNSTETFHNCTGSVELVDRTVKCHVEKGGHGSLDLATGLAKSCNGFFIKLGLKIGVKSFNKYFRSFGLNELTGIDQPNESIGQSVKENKMKELDLGNTSYGQTATITAIQLASGASAVANGGRLITPHLVDKIIDDEGNVIYKADDGFKRQVVSAETSSIMREKLKDVIYKSYGTGYEKFNLSGYEAFGKSGSGEIKGVGGTDEEGVYKYTGSFIACAPADDPQVLVLFGVRRTRGNYIPGGDIAGPQSSTIMQVALQALNVPTTQAKSENKVPDVLGMPQVSAGSLLNSSGYAMQSYGSGDTVVHQIPESGETLASGGVVALFMDEESYEKTVAVPNFSSMTVSAAIAAAKSAGINAVAEDAEDDSTIVTGQSVDASDTVRPGSIVELYTKDE